MEYEGFSSLVLQKVEIRTKAFSNRAEDLPNILCHEWT